MSASVAYALLIVVAFLLILLYEAVNRSHGGI